MNILITCGPSYEPMDGARRLTNFSTGTLGIKLANFFVKNGHQVTCLKGEGSTCCDPCHAPKIRHFGTNDDLARLLAEAARSEGVDAVLHAAALCDYRLEKVLNAAGETLASPKFATRDGRLHLVLAPALKVLPQLRGWFPKALLVGWKYELAGTRDDAFEKAWKQLQECATDACVLNGAAYGAGFALCRTDRHVKECDDVGELCIALSNLLPQGAMLANVR